MSESGEEDGDKPYEATQKKLSEARKKGEIVRSPDMTTLGVCAVTLLAFLYLFQNVFPSMIQMMSLHIEEAAIFKPLQEPLRTTGRVGVWVGQFTIVALVIPAILVFAALVASKQVVFSGEKLAPKMNRISIVANAKKKFGISGIVEFLKSLVKFCVFSLAFYWMIAFYPKLLDGSVRMEPFMAIQNVYDLAVVWFGIVILGYILFGFLDLAWQMHEHAKKNRMSHKEMKDEVKTEEGDEAVRQQRRAKAEEIATNRMLLDVPRASVVITNPTHFAVALKWSGGSNSVPECVARGTDETARKIREIAAQSGVPLFRDPPTARELYATVKVGMSIDRDHYKAVAIAISYAQRIQKMDRDGA